MSDKQALSPIPPHVPAALVVDYDYLKDARLSPDVHEGLRAIAGSAPPLFYTPRNGGHWVAMGRDVAFDVARNYEIFSNAPQSADRQKLPRRIPISFDPPEHNGYRQVLVQAFSPATIRAMQDDFRAFAVALIDDIAPVGRCDFLTEVAEPLPVKFFMQLMGLPLERFAEFRRWVADATGTYGEQRRASVLDKVLEMTAPLVRERQAERRDDLISRIIDAEVDGRRPTFDEVQAYCLMLFIAGLDTVVNAMAFGVRALAMRPELQARLRADQTLIPRAAEELLRRYSIAMPGRQVAADTVFHGVELRRGEVVTIALPAANLDPAAFAEPGEIDLDRGEAHIAFGAGPHRCVGSHLARLELRVLYEELLGRLPPFRLDPEHHAAFHSASVIAVESLPLVWDPPAA